MVVNVVSGLPQVLTIAHRLETIADSDAVLVLAGAPQAGGSRLFLTPSEHFLTSFNAILMVIFSGHLPTLPSF